MQKVISNKILDKMNPQQREAILHTDGPLLILAGAGSGKTTVIVNRIANIVSTQKACPHQILAITFTNKAAAEVKSRLISILGEDARDIWASTFHATCSKILRINSKSIGYPAHFSIYDTDDSNRLIKECQRNFDIDDKILSHKSILSEISRAKDSLIDVDEFTKNAQGDNRLVEIAKVYDLYQSKLKEADAMDFDDLIFNTVKLFKNNKEVLKAYQAQFKYILIDEYQDTNSAQYELVRLLSMEHHNLCVVGDDDQSIYKFRGATIDNILNFEHTFPKTKVIKLEQNYRSTQTILNTANCLIKNNSNRKEKKLWTENEKGELITIHTAANEQDEAMYISDHILEGVTAGKKYSDYAVLYRMNSQSNSLERILATSGVPYKVVGGVRFYDRKEIKDIISYMNIIANPADDTRLRRIINYPKRAIGEKTIAIAADIAAREHTSLFSIISRAEEYPDLSRSISKLNLFVATINKLIEFSKDPAHSIHDLYKMILEETGYVDAVKKEKRDSDSRVQNINELASNILIYEDENKEKANLLGFLEEISLLTDINKAENTDCVTLMTMHSAKGLEFPVVFLPGFEEGIFPGIQSIYNPDNMEEERRLAYVGVTRAKEKLFIIKSYTRMIFGSTSKNKGSRFLDEIPEELVEKTQTNASSKMVKLESSVAKREREMKHQALMYTKNFYHKAVLEENSFNAGDSVNHKTFGKGVVLSVTPIGNDKLLEVRFDNNGVKKLLSNYTKLQQITNFVTPSNV